jgi:hypothetical protein
MTQMFKNTPTLGMKIFKGQKQLVVDALLSSPEPKTLEEIVTLVNKDGAYGELINDWAQEKAGGVRGSVHYHLKELMKFGMVKEIPDTLTTSPPASTSTKPIPAKNAKGDVVPVTNDADMLDMARHWYGYGRWEGKYWFIGPEPGQPEGDNIKERCKAWIDLGRGELVDCKDHHLGFGWKKWHKESPPTQPTWRPLIQLLLATKDGTQPDLKDIRSYQQKHWGMKNAETCVIELSSLAAPKLDAPGEHVLFQKERIKEIRQRILDHEPTFVVMYGTLHKPHWERIAGGPFGPDNILKIGSTVAAFAPHPVSFGLTNDYWLQLAEKLRHECGLGVT